MKRAHHVYHFTTTRIIFFHRLLRCELCAALTDCPQDHARWHEGVPLNAGANGRQKHEETVEAKQ